MNLFDRLKASCSSEWEAYIHHEFVSRIGDGTLPTKCFQHYLKQDYLFLIQFARCFAVAAYKSDNLRDMKHAQEGLSAIIDVELDLHLKYCADWEIKTSELNDLVTSPANKAYTDYVMDQGMKGGLLELYVALSPCAVGYAEIGQWLNNDPNTKRAGNPYLDWIEMYSSDEYVDGALGMKDYIEELADSISPPQILELSNIFGKATSLEIKFWQMGLDIA